MGIDEQTKLDWVNVSMQLEMLTFQIRLLVSVLTTQLSIRLPVSALRQPVKGDLHTRTPTLHVGLQDGTSGYRLHSWPDCTIASIQGWRKRWGINLLSLLLITLHVGT